MDIGAEGVHPNSKQATGLDARALRAKWPAQFLSHWYGISYTEYVFECHCLLYNYSQIPPYFVILDSDKDDDNDNNNDNNDDDSNDKNDNDNNNYNNSSDDD